MTYGTEVIILWENMGLTSRIKNFPVLVLILLLLLPVPGKTCTTFFLDLEDRPVLGTNFDWSLGSGMIIINKRGLLKMGMAVAEDDFVSPPVWTARYASLSFNQYGRETPMGGINEAGLVVHQMMLREARFPQPDSRKPLKNLQWIQYQLDNACSVAEVIKSTEQVRIQNKEVPGLHYMIADSSGDCASIEWIRGKLVVHRGATMPVKILANNTYRDSFRYLKRHKSFGGSMAFDESSSLSLDRFARAARMVTAYPDKSSIPAVDYAFDVLGNVADDTTQWRIVYDINRLRIYYKTRKSSRLRWLDIDEFDLSCSDSVKIIDVDANLTGNISQHFIDYTRPINTQYIRHAFSNTSFSQHISEEFIQNRSSYPDSFSCVEQAEKLY